MAPYKSLYPKARLRLSQTERIASQVMVLPTGQTINPEMVQSICGLFRCAFENAGEIRKLLGQKPAKAE
jgi:dTDP-4-amino-4,6-dideoxygalactose transaminase